MNAIRIIVEGDYACFTRPEFKVERVSYEVPTPSALEGMLKSVYWKPEMRYVIDRIVVFNPIRFTNVRRNEVKEKIPMTLARNVMKGGNGDTSLYSSESRNQRGAMILKDVRYGIEFHMEAACSENVEKKHSEILKRRLKKGQCFKTPHLGCREFSVKRMSLVTDFTCERTANLGDVDLGYMLYGLEFNDQGTLVNRNYGRSDYAQARYYHPHMVNGVIDVNRYKGEESWS